HIAVLEAANLVLAVRRGRERLHYLNPAPINDISERWITHYDLGRVKALSDLKRAVEDKTVDKPEFVYVTYIETTPQELWRALTDPAFTDRYWGGGPSSEWRVGSTVRWQLRSGAEFQDLGQVVLEADPFRRLSYTWQNYQWERHEMFGWTEETFSELIKEKISKVTFEIEPMGDVVKLTVVHDGFEGETEMLKGIRQGWPGILSKLKTMLERDKILEWSSEGRPAPTRDRPSESQPAPA
ncbi:MAG: SRPBCC domain-containing protein, partial [Nitrososphaerales archaeon]